MFDWDDLRVLLCVARERTLSGAARKLRVDQSTVGRRLQALEAAAGVRLFDRTPSGYALTAAAESVLGSVEAIESSAIAVERKLSGQDQRLEGRVRVATSDSFADWFLIRQLGALRRAHPGVWIELATGNRPVDLARREADISLRFSKPQQPSLVARKLGVAAWSVYAADSYCQARGKPNWKTRGAGHEVIAFDEELAGTVGAAWTLGHAARASVALSTNSLLCQAAAVEAGLGFGALPCVCGDARPGLRRVAGVIGQHEIWLVVHPDVKASARVRAVLDQLTRLVKAHAPLLSGRRPQPAQ